MEKTIMVPLRRIWEYSIQIVFFLTVNEFLYNSQHATGHYGMYLLLFYIALLLIMLVVEQPRLTVSDWLITLLVPPMIIYLGGGTYYAKFYGLMLLLFLLVSKLRFSNWSLFFHLLFLSGLVMTLYQQSIGMTRVTGFLSTSPTIFSVIILITQVYFLFATERPLLFQLLLSLLSCYQIFLTGSRSTFFLSVLVLVYKLVFAPILASKKMGIGGKVITSLSFVSVFVSFLFFLQPLFHLRENGYQSTLSRKNFAAHFLQRLMDNPGDYLFGKGAGYTLYEIPRIFDWLQVETYPLHQDILMWVIEYGFIGLILLLFVVFYKNRYHWMVGLLFCLATFHNLFISPLLALLLLILNKEFIRESENHV